ncbi:antA/AntB antirepressor family protein [Xenorhabdus ehlersii]|uniref:AntA/AntB antirepressor family protein n=1 Tax=Xenorhabdus ehlersii TaxID=290111 RepID=A0A2D0INJ4_9GAMM|nr:antA/AntB antirepressor family protein [Xenorhabdus ehlersii]PHM23362.1 antA/AntB antirepressor family protein [Xenorhabdus ehlersii]RKE93373.1 phage anti-repressor protein [Xenorhabdus ehlersii]
MTKKNMTVMGQGFAHAENSRNGITELSFAEMLPVIQCKIGGQVINGVSAKALHEALGVKRAFAAWVGERINQYSFTKDQDYSVVVNLSYPNSDSAKSRQQLTKDYHVTISMAKELAMVERTEQGRLIRQYFIKCEEALHKVAPAVTKQLRNELKSRLKVANYFKPMCSALDMARMEQGKITLPRHYTNESNMLNRIVLAGMTAKQWAQHHGIIGDPRDAMSELQLEHLSYLEQTNTTLIELGMDYYARKDKLTGLSQKWLAQRVEANQ